LDYGAVVLNDRTLGTDATDEGLLVSTAAYLTSWIVRFRLASITPSTIEHIWWHHEEAALRVPTEVDVDPERWLRQPPLLILRRNLRKAWHPDFPGNTDI
jgi:hypothetical protein